MFRWVVGSSLRFRFLLLALAAALLVFGSQELRKMPVDVFPEFAPPKVEIQTEGPGMTAAEVEEMITIPMDEALRGIPNVDVIRSSSVLALSQVTVLFKMGTDLMDARQRVQERVMSPDLQRGVHVAQVVALHVAVEDVVAGRQVEGERAV